MSRIIRLFGSQSLALLALCVALSGGTALAVGSTVAKNTVVSKSIKNGQVKARDLGAGSVSGTSVLDSSLGTADVAGLTGADVSDGSLTGADVADGSLTGADVDEGSLAAVPSARVATLGGLARGTSGASCNPDTTAYVTCATLTFTLPDASNLVLLADARVTHQTNALYIAEGTCRLRLDSVAVPGGAMYVSKAAEALFATSAMTRVVSGSAGSHTLELECNDDYYATYSAVALNVVALSAQ